MGADEQPCVGVDAGQSTIRLQVVGEPTMRTAAGLSHLASADDLVDRIAGALDGLDAIERLVIGMTTLPADTDERRALATTIAARLGAAEVWVTGDEVASHAGAFEGRSGVVLIAGTGVACIAADPTTGTLTTIDGAGFLIGDEGGGFWLGRHAIRAALAAREGRAPATALGELVVARLGPLDRLAARVHAGSDPVNQIAHAALDVIAAAADGDAVACELLDEAAERLGRSVRAAKAAIDAPTPVVLDGRLLAAGSPLEQRLVAWLRRELDDNTHIEHHPGSGLTGATALAASTTEPMHYQQWITVSRPDAASPSTGSTASPGAAVRSIDGAMSVLGRIRDRELHAVAAAAEQLADTIADGGLVHVFGTGHSHLLAEEVFYRAGGLAVINPVLVPDLMLHTSAIGSTELERTSGLADEIFDDADIAAGDTLIVASNSGGNAVTNELAERCRATGACVVAVVSRRHAATKSTARLVDLADIVIDNHGIVGDAAVTVEGVGTKVGPTSTVAGAAIMQALVAATVQRLVARGVDPGVLRSANTPGGDAHNERLLAPLRNRIRSL